MLLKQTLRFHTIFLLTFFISQINAQALVKDQASINAAIDAYYEELLKDTKVIGASIAIVDNGKIVHANGYGFSDLAKGIKATAKTIYPIASTTKSLTAFAIMQLYEKGLLDINESIKIYIPELTISSRFNDGNEIFIKDILSHISGLPSDIWNGMAAEKVPDFEWVLKELNKQTTISPNQYIDSYSNVGFGLLGELISRVSGMTYKEYMQEHIFKVLDMNSSQVGFEAEKSSKGYRDGKAIRFSEERDGAGGGISSNVLDMATFVNMLLNDGTYKGESILTKESINAIEGDKLKGILMESSEAYGYGMGVFSASLTTAGKETRSPMYGHSGYAPPFHADIRYIPELNVGVVVLVNTKKASIVRSAGTLLRAYLEESRGMDYQLRFKKSDLSSHCTDSDLAGSYNMGMAMVHVKNTKKIKLKVDGAKVVLKRIGDSNDYSITAKLFGFFPLKVKGVVFKFKKRGDDVVISQLDLDNNKEEYVAKKTKKVAIPNSWKSTVGTYDIVKTYPCSIPEFDFSKAVVTIEEKNGFMYLQLKNSKQTFPFYLNIASDKKAYSGGMGRHMGYLVEILDNGNVYFSGFEFRKRS